MRLISGSSVSWTQRLRGALSVLSLASLVGCGEVPGAPSDVETVTAPLTISDFGGWHMVPGGSLTAAPGVTMRSSKSIDVIARGTDNEYFYINGFTTTGAPPWTWGSWGPLGGAFAGAPGVAGWAPNSGNLVNLAVVGRWTDNSVRVNVCVSSGGSCQFGSWLALPSLSTSNDPAIVFMFPNLFVFAPDSGGAVRWTNNNVSSGFNNANWSAWATIPSGVVNAGVAATVLDGTLFVAGRGTNNQFFVVHSSNGTTWSAWTEVGGPSGPTFTSGPALSSWSGGHLDLFGTQLVSGANEVFNLTSTNSGASWPPSGSAVPASNLIGSPAAFSPAVGTLQLFGTGTDVPQHHAFQNSYQQ